MAFFTRFENKGLYRLWLFLFWGWVITFLALGGVSHTKHAYMEYERSEYCDHEKKVREEVWCYLTPEEEAKIPTNSIAIVFWVLVALIAPPYGLYYCCCIGRWIWRGFYP